MALSSQRQWPANAGHNLYAVPASSMTAAFNDAKKDVFIEDNDAEDSEDITIVQFKPNAPARTINLESTKAAVADYLQQEQEQGQKQKQKQWTRPKAIKSTIILVRQCFSWSELDITATAAQTLFTHFGISPGFWHVVKKFGKKVSTDQDLEGGFNDLVLPATALTGDFSSEEGSFELSYTARYVEQHGRKGRANYDDPWSIRKIGVAHRYDPSTNSNTVVILNPSKALEQRINGLGPDLQTLDVHRIILGAVTERWGEYLAYLESVCKDISDKAVLAKSPQQLSNLGFDVHFSDAQRIGHFRDKIILVVHMLDLNRSIFDNLLTTISRLNWPGDGPSRTYSSLASLSIQTKQWKSQTENLLQRLDGGAALVQNILDAKSLVALQSTSAISAELAAIARADALKANKEARTLSIITILGFLYLPASFATSLLGTQYIKISHNEHGKMSIILAPEMIIFVVLTLLLLGITYAGWLIWDQHLQRAGRAEEERISEKMV